MASLSYSIALASAPVEGTVFGTKGHIQIHNALHHSTRLSVHLAGGSAAWQQLRSLLLVCVDGTGGFRCCLTGSLGMLEACRFMSLSSLLCWLWNLPHQPAHKEQRQLMTHSPKRLSHGQPPSLNRIIPMARLPAACGSWSPAVRTCAACPGSVSSLTASFACFAEAPVTLGLRHGQA